MKRIVLFVFLAFVVTFWALPSSRSQAAQREGEESQQLELKLLRKQLALPPQPPRNPHEALSVESQAAERMEQINRATRELTATLPPITRVIKKPAAKQATAEYTNIIDKEIFGTLVARGVEPAEIASDEEFCRRVFLDITGLPPTPDRLLKYIGDPDPQKRDKLITELISSDAFIDLWTNWLADLTENSAYNPDYPRERNAQHFFLRDAVAKNKPFNQIASEIITFVGRWDKGPAAFIIRPIFNAEIEQDAYDEIAGLMTRTFLGVQSTCVSCHNGQGHLETVNLYLSKKQREDFWGLAAFFPQINVKYSGGIRALKLVNNKYGKYIATTDDGMRPPRNGGVISPSYQLFGEGRPNSGEELRTAFARIITSDPQFARAFVNRVFARFFTVGIVEPLNNFDLARLDPNNPPPAPWQLQPSHPALLNGLADWFRQNNYDMRALIKYIASAQAYGLSSRYDEAKWKPEYARLYARKLVRRMQSEEVLDAVAQSTLVAGQYKASELKDPFKTAMSLPGVEEPYYDPLVTRFLENFGRGNRSNVPRSDTGSVTQALALFNSDLVIKRLSNQNGLSVKLATALNKKEITPEEAVTTLYLNTLARRPSEAEVARLKDYISKGGQSVGDLQWLLLNRFDFLYNY